MVISPIEHDPTLYENAAEITEYISRTVRDTFHQGTVLLYSPGVDPFLERLANRALPINYTNPVSYFSGEEGAISAVHSIVTLDNTIISWNRARIATVINSTEDSEIRLLGNVMMSDN
jgi:hypothetical protein